MSETIQLPDCPTPELCLKRDTVIAQIVLTYQVTLAEAVARVNTKVFDRVNAQEANWREGKLTNGLDRILANITVEGQPDA